MRTRPAHSRRSKLPVFPVAVFWLVFGSTSRLWWPQPARAESPTAPALGVTILREGPDSRPIAIAGQRITISVGVSNLNGTAPARASVLKVVLPQGLKLIAATPPADRTETGGGSLIWNLGTVQAHAFPSLFDMDLEVAPEIKAGTPLTVSANVVTSDRDADPKHENAVFELMVLPAAAQLSVQSELEGVDMLIGEPIKFASTVSNWGSVAAKASSLTLTLPPGVSFKLSDPAPSAKSINSISWQLGDIAPAASITVSVTIELDRRLGANASDESPAGLLKFKLDASTTTTQANPANNHLEIDRRVELKGSDLKVWLNVQGADAPDELPIGKDVTYTVLYGNFGNAPAQKVVVSLSLWQGLSLVHADPAPASTSKSDRFAGGVYSWNAGGLRVGQSHTIKCRVHVASVPEYGALVMATIAAPGANIGSGENVAYSLRHAPRAAGRHGAARGGHPLRLVFLIAIFGLVLWVSLRALRRSAAA